MRIGLLLLVILLVPAATAEGSPVSLYVHLIGLQDSPINTQEPQYTYGPGEENGLVRMSNCIELPAGTTSIAAQQWHTWYSYSSPGPVGYEYDEEGRPRIHQQRGLSSDLSLEPSSDFYWHLATDADTGIDLTVQGYLRVTIRLGDEVSVGNEALNEGAIVARAQSEPLTLRPGIATDEVTHHDVDGVDVYAFHLALGHELATIPEADSFNIRVDFWQDLPHCSDDDGANISDLWPYQSPGYWNRWDITAHEPIRVEYLHPQLIGDDLVVHASARSVFGNYDFGEGGALRVVDAAGNDVSDLFEMVSFRTDCYCHDHLLEPADQAWVANTTHLGDGRYEGTVHFDNLQGSAQATARFAFELGGDGQMCGTTGGEYGCAPLAVNQESPAPALPLALLALAAIAMRRR